MKRILALALCAAIMLSSCIIASADIAFSDLPSGHWAYSYVATLVGDGTINGFEDGTFRPEKSLTRAELSTIVWRIDLLFG